MKRLLFVKIALFSIFFLTLSSFTKEAEEQQVLDELIATTERQLVLQKKLKTLISEFQHQQDLFYRGEQTKDLAKTMIQTAVEILKISEENHYLHLFPPFFVEELKLFAGIAKKKL